MEFDHIAVAGETLAEATAHVEDALGLQLRQGGEHAVFHTHNTLLGLADGLYLEAIAVNPDAPVPSRPRWFDLDRFAGPARLTNWICRCEDLEATLAQLPTGFGAPVSLQRGALKWRMAVPESGILPFENCAPALIQWHGPMPDLPASGAALSSLHIHHPQAEELQALLAPMLQDARIFFANGPAKLLAQFDISGTVHTLS